MRILGIDPGPRTSGIVEVEIDCYKLLVRMADKAMENDEVLELARHTSCLVAIEAIECLYAHVGKETVRTIRFVGNLEEAAQKSVTFSPSDVKKIVCLTGSAKDPAVRQALIDRFGSPGTKKEPGQTHGVTSHAWRALAVAVAAHDTITSL